MPIIHLETFIDSDLQTVYDLSRSVNLHEISTEKTNEKAVAGKTSGFLEMGENVTWRAKHFGIYQLITVKITGFEPPVFFEDTMTKGVFKGFCHRHNFETVQNQVKMIDSFEYEAPLGILGRFADVLFLKNYMKRFLKERNKVIKEFAETDKWKGIIFDSKE